MTRNTNAFASPALPSANNSHDGGPLHGTETPPVRFGETGWGLHTVASSSLPAQRPRNLATATIPTATPYTNAQLLGHAPAWGGAYQASAPQVRNVQQTVAQHTVAQRSVAQPAARKRPNVAGPQHARFESVPPRPTHPAAGYGGSIPHPQSPVPPPGYYQPISSSPKPRRPPPIPTAAPPARPPLPHSTTQRSKRPSNPTQWQAPPVSAPRPHPDVIDLTLSNPDLGSLSSTRPLYPSVHPHLGSSEQGSLHGMVPAGPAHWHGDNRLMPGGFSPQYMEQRMLRVAGSTRGVEEMSLPDAASSSSHTAWDRDVAQPTIIAPFPAPSPAPTTKTATKRKRKAQDDDPAGVSGTVDVAEKAPAKRLKTGVKRARKVPPVDVEHISSATSKTGPAKRSEPTPSSKTLPLPSNVQVTASSRSATPQHCQPEAVAASSRQATPARWQLEYKPAPRPPLPPHLAGVIIASDIDIIALGRKEYHEIQASKATAVRKMTATGTKGLKSTEVVKNSRLVPPPAPPVMAATALATDALGMSLPQPTDDDEFDNLFGPDLVDGE